MTTGDKITVAAVANFAVSLLAGVWAVIPATMALAIVLHERRHWR